MSRACVEISKEANRQNVSQRDSPVLSPDRARHCQGQAELVERRVGEGRIARAVR